MLARVIVIATCLSVCLSVTRRYCVKTKKASVMISSPSGSSKTLVFWRQISSPNSKGFPRTGASNKGGVGKFSDFLDLEKNNVITRPNFQLCGAGLPYADFYTYLGHIISADLSDNVDIMRQTRCLYVEQIPLFGNLTVLRWMLNLCCSERTACQFMAVSCGAQCHNMLTTNCVLPIMMVLDNFKRT